MEEKKKKDRSYRRHRFIYLLLYPLAWLILRPLKRFTPQYIPKIKGPMFILCNHNADLDPFFVGLASPFRHMYFVASEHLFRRGFGSRFMMWAAGPIARMKGSTDGSAAMSVLRNLKEGHERPIPSTPRWAAWPRSPGPPWWITTLPAPICKSPAGA